MREAQNLARRTCCGHMQKTTGGKNPTGRSNAIYFTAVISARVVIVVECQRNRDGSSDDASQNQRVGEETEQPAVSCATSDFWVHGVDDAVLCCFRSIRSVPNAVAASSSVRNDLIRPGLGAFEHESALCVSPQLGNFLSVLPNQNGSVSHSATCVVHESTTQGTVV